MFYPTKAADALFSLRSENHFNDCVMVWPETVKSLKVVCFARTDLPIKAPIPLKRPDLNVTDRSAPSMF